MSLFLWYKEKKKYKQTHEFGATERTERKKKTALSPPSSWCQANATTLLLLPPTFVLDGFGTTWWNHRARKKLPSVQLHVSFCLQGDTLRRSVNVSQQPIQQELVLNLGFCSVADVFSSSHYPTKIVSICSPSLPTAAHCFLLWAAAVLNIKVVGFFRPCGLFYFVACNENLFSNCFHQPGCQDFFDLINSNVVTVSL